MRVSRTALRDGWIWGTVLALFLGAPPALAIAGSTHPWGFGGFTFGLVFLGTCVPPVALSGMVLGLILVTIANARSTGTTFLVASLAIALGVPALMAVGWLVREQALDSFATRADPVVAAIESYADDHGRAPQTLRDLVPDYLVAVPDPGVASGERYEYATAHRARLALNDGAWMLSVPLTPISIGRWEELIYVSEPDYEQRLVGRDVERRGRWLHLRGE